MTPTTRQEKLSRRFELRDAIASGDDHAIASVYRKHAPRVTAVAMSVLRDRDLAADVAQEVFLRLWKNPTRFDPERGSLGAYLAVDAKGRSIDLVRSRQAAQKREKVDHVERLHEGRISTEEEAMQSIVGVHVHEVLATLPEEQRIPITLAFFDDISYSAVAERLALPEGTVKSRIRSGLRDLRTGALKDLVAA